MIEERQRVLTFCMMATDVSCIGESLDGMISMLLRMTQGIVLSKKTKSCASWLCWLLKEGLWPTNKGR